MLTTIIIIITIITIITIIIKGACDCSESGWKVFSEWGCG
jgi:hypothetical protein